MKTKMAMHNDPKVRHKKYNGGGVDKAEASKAFKSQSRLAALQNGSAKVFGTEGNISDATGTSIFDPVLTELCYLWFTGKGASILDPFAGGSVRGIVAAQMGRAYTGVELRSEQVEANRVQAEAICTEQKPIWITGDSLQEVPKLEGSFDFVFSCPPYGDLEVYSDLDADISNKAWPDFLNIYRKIIASAVAKLKNDRFACFVVGDFRDEKGFYRNFVSETIAAFQDSGAALYNEAILLTAIGSLPIRAARPFNSARKLGKTHQNALVFCKGDPKIATEACGGVELISAEQWQSWSTPEAP
jgi:DNA modification methylase